MFLMQMWKTLYKHVITGFGFTSSSETQGQLVGAGKVKSDKEKNWAKKSAIPDFSSPEFLLVHFDFSCPH